MRLRRSSAILLVMLMLPVSPVRAQVDKLTTVERQRLEQYRLSPSPASLEKMRNVHPRIFLTKEQVENLKELIRNTHAGLWEETKRQADRAVAEGPPVYRGNGDGEGRWGFEQLWQRNVGNFMSTLAMAWMMTNDPKYLASAREWAMASCGYETWGGLGWADGVDLAASHQLLGLGLIYDWCYDALDEEAKTTIRETLVMRTRTMVRTCVTEDIWWHRADSTTRIWYQWQEAYLQNHLWVNMCGAAVAGLAIFDEVDEAESWIGLSLAKFKMTMNALGNDGASHEGVQYWDYGVENLLKFMDIARSLLDVDMFDREWFRNTAGYRIYLGLPVNGWTRYSNAVDIGDCSRGSWYSDYNLRALAGEYGDGYAQWLANVVDVGSDNSPRLRWLNLLWFDPSVEAKALDGLPTMHHFTDMDIVSSRSGWSGDESLVIFKCGPYIGHKAVKEMPYNASAAQHVHPDAGHFIVFGGGEFLIRDDGYHCKWTDQHNTLLVDGRGQSGEGGMWFDGAGVHGRETQPHIVSAVSTPLFDHMTGDVKAAYPEELGVKHFTRHLLFLKPDVLIVADDIITDKPRNLELRFHPEQENAEQHDVSFQLRGRNTVLKLEALTPAGVDISEETMKAENDSGFLDPLPTVRLQRHSDTWRNATALSWTAKSGDPEKIDLNIDGGIWTFRAGTRTVVLDWETGKADMK